MHQATKTIIHSDLPRGVVESRSVDFVSGNDLTNDRIATAPSLLAQLTRLLFSASETDAIIERCNVLLHHFQSRENIHQLEHSMIVAAIQHAVKHGHARILRELLAVAPPGAAQYAWDMATHSLNMYRYPKPTRVHTDVFRVLFFDSRTDRADPAANDSDALKLACAWGPPDLALLLLNDPERRSNPNPNTIVTVRDATILAALLKDNRIDPSINCSQAFRVACTCDDDEMHPLVAMYLRDPRVDPAAVHNDALKRAVFSNNVATVAMLLNDVRVDPSDSQNTALFDATCKKPSITQLLINHPRFVPCLNSTILAFSRAKSCGNNEVVALLTPLLARLQGSQVTTRSNHKKLRLR